MADNPDEKIKLKMFHAEIINDAEKLNEEVSRYKDIPVVSNVTQQQVLDNARVMAKVMQERGYRIVSGRTDCHLFLLDLREKPVTGLEAEQALGRANITVNKNSVPNDTRTPTVTSGVRIGSPAMTTRGFREIEAEKLGHLIADILDAPQDEAVNNKVRAAVKALCDKYPVYRKS